MTPKTFVVTDRNGATHKFSAEDWEAKGDLIVFHSGSYAVGAFRLSDFQSLREEPQQGAGLGKRHGEETVVEFDGDEVQPDPPYTCPCCGNPGRRLNYSVRWNAR